MADGTPLGRKTILVVDDYPSVLSVTKARLQKAMDVDVICALATEDPSSVATEATQGFSSKEGLAKIIAEKKPDLILTDYLMGVMTGANTTLVAANEVAPGIPVVLHTTSVKDIKETPETCAKFSGIFEKLPIISPKPDERLPHIANLLKIPLKSKPVVSTRS